MRLSSLLTTSLLFTSALCTPSPKPETDTASSLEGRAAQRGRKKLKSTDYKYFDEVGQDEILSHYDSRYYKKTFNDEERVEALHHLIRAYLIIFRERNVETWIAHGTLLGWWWNGKIMPWDRDLDTQVSATTLTWMGENLNMTLHNYTSVDSKGKEFSREYLIDVNPFSKERTRGDGKNVIDARFIDTTNGVYADITGLAEVNPSNQPGVWSCKNFHRYRTRDLYPLRETEFEGVPALVPYSFDKVLTEEYSARALTKTYHEGHQWIPEQKEWRKQALDRGQAAKSKFGTIPHVPKSIQSSSKSNGLKNLAGIL